MAGSDTDSAGESDTDSETEQNLLSIESRTPFPISDICDVAEIEILSLRIFCAKPTVLYKDVLRKLELTVSSDLPSTVPGS